MFTQSAVVNAERIVAVTGAAGSIGQACLKALQDQGAHVIAIDKVKGSGGGEWRKADLTNTKQSQRALTGATHLIHLAAWPSPDQVPPHQVLSDNVTIASNVLQAFASGSPVTASLASSMSVYGFAWAPEVQAPDFVPVTESHPLRPHDYYSLSKVFLEELAAMWNRTSGFTTVSLRLPFVAKNVPNSGEGFFNELTENPTGELGRRHLWSYLLIQDAADALIRSLDVADGRAHVVNIAQTKLPEDWDPDALIKHCFPTTQIRGDIGIQGLFNSKSSDPIHGLMQGSSE